MWPFSEMSLSAATLWGTLANWGLLLSLLSGVLCTFVVVKTTDVKEEHWDKAREKADERIAELVTESLQAKASLETAKAEIATAHERAATANLKAEEIRARLAPRQIDATIFIEKLRDKPKWPIIEVLYVDEAEPLQLTLTLLALLQREGWETPIPRPIRGPNSNSPVSPDLIPLLLTFGAGGAGVAIVAREINMESNSPQWGLVGALADSLSTKSANGGRDPSLPEGKLRIVVGPKN